MLNIPKVVIIILAVIGVITCIVFSLFYKNYLNRRLKGEGKIRKFPQPLTFILSVGLAVSFITNIAFIVSAISKNSAYNDLLEKTQPRSTIVTDFEKYPEYASFKNALINNSLAGYFITKEIQGDFECIIALSRGEIKKLPFMPQYFIFIQYKADVSDDFQMERWYYYENQEHGFGSTGKFEKETMIVGNTLEANLYIEIKTIIKIAPENSSTKENWSSIAIYAESLFIIENIDI